MTNQHLNFLLHHTPPLEFDREPVLFLGNSFGDGRAISIGELSEIDGPIITHSFSFLVDWFRRKALPLPATIVDLETAKKLVIGRPKSDVGVTHWSMSKMLLELVPEEFYSDHVRVALTSHMGNPLLSESNDLRWMSTVVASLPSLWNILRTELEQRSETRRWEDVEVPVYNAMLDVQYRGLNIDVGERDATLKTLEREFVDAHYELAIQKGIDVDRAFKDIKYLNDFLARPLEIQDFTSANEIINVRKISDPTCSLLDSVAKARDDRRILLRTGGSEGRCFPVFDTMGTVTGRIMVTDPALQYLRKRYRRIISPGPERSLVYLDYSQFEPNIMASVTNDSQLLSLCDTGDLYERLAIQLLGDATQRDTIKRMFLAYSYGMTARALADYLIDSGVTKDDAERIISTRFVPLFSGVEKWKDSISATLLNSGRVSTVLGNNRYRAKKGELDRKEKRWAISQIIQGTGSLILKKAIIKIRKNLPEALILLPMHDALLLEVPSKSTGELTHELLNYFREAFLSVCPASFAAVRQKSFGEA